MEEVMASKWSPNLATLALSQAPGAVPPKPCATSLNFYGTAHFSIQASIAASDAGLGGAVVVANITVNSAPFITTQPASLTVGAGNTAQFVVRASGTATLTYQWKFNGGAMAGATNATLNSTNTGKYTATGTGAGDWIYRVGRLLIVD